MHPEFYSFHIITDGDTFISDKTFVNLNEPVDYKESMAAYEASQKKEAMYSEI